MSITCVMGQGEGIIDESLEKQLVMTAVEAGVRDVVRTPLGWIIEVATNGLDVNYVPAEH